ncbi:MAG: cystathionine gamma-synthase [Acidimicrobiaceae bacterium]|nr:cystathionine gamma-synthase [Acidimicrobiaceae bacterium]MBT5580144.1 cystathionine gamma-synthase [Acidimicrobiaceae bacterium]MBT5852071.1 cystathionine gamma-synthase [Acidimicrobiaceae bacterium]
MFADPQQWGFETRAIRAGQNHDASSGAVVTPISLATTFVQEEPGKHRGYEYSRTGNPTRSALQDCLASLEGAAHGLAFGSGMAAEDTLLRTLSPGDHIVLGNDAYGGTYRLISAVLAPSGIEWSAADLTDPDSLRAAMRPETKVVWAETPTNPLLTVIDLAAIAEVAHSGGAKFVVDNTFATPYLQQPLSHGADVVVHSTTKYCGGHSDVVGGFVATNDDGLADRLAYLQNAIGAVGSPFDNYLTLRGLKTLAVRMDRHCENAQAIVDLLVDHPAVSHVLYPGLPDHPGHEAAARQMSAFGGMVSFRVASGRDAAMRMTTTTKVFSLAESLGAVESLIEHPGVMTHASAAGSPLEVPDDLVRLSVGIESTQDLIDDVAQALDGL